MSSKSKDRGRSAEKPTQIPARGWWDIAMRVKDRVGQDNVGLIAAGVAFYGLLALFPALTALLAVSGLVVDPTQVIGMIDELSAVMPREVAEIIIAQAEQVAGSREAGLGLATILGLGLALWSASKGMASLIQGLNVAYQEREKRGFIKLKLMTLVLTLGLIVGAIYAVVTVMGVPIVISIVNLGGATEVLVAATSWSLLIGMMITGLGLVYTFGPSRSAARWRWLTPGAIAAVLIWLAGSVSFAFYAANFASYNETFGSLAGVIVLLTWLWLSAYIVLMGAELNAEIEAQTRHDTTTGAPQPMGERGAQKADNLGEVAADS